ncbi:hypothetical protein [Bacillus sp. CH30_1T]|uniref:hypothetical protein n=1 Tax=Bacillus sp. CH30_1T TaxID=2604836 RepID=UPI0021CDDF4F|nr:hypothetical protein [Bacillus sp. CH30_1T]
MNENTMSEQIFIYSLSTESFLNEDEHKLYSEKQQLEIGKSAYKKLIKKLEDSKEVSDEDIDKYYASITFVDMDKLKINKPLKFLMETQFDQNVSDELIIMLKDSPENKKEINKLKSRLFQKVNKRVSEIKDELDKLAAEHKGKRILRQDDLKDSNKVAQFKSTLTRTLGVEPNETTTDIIMIRAFRYNIFESLVKNGFVNQDGVEYQYLTSSAGGIRNKKSVFIKKDVYENIESTLYAGLTPKKINDKGGMNPNKYNAYTALTMSSSIPWDLDLDKCIVVDDFETKVWGYVDEITKNYDINPNVWKGVGIPHTDGAGIMLPTVSNKALQIRLPFFKGLLIPTLFTKFIEEYDGASPIVKDIYGQKWDVIKDDIQIIFTKSMFKAHSYFKNEENEKDSWLDYKRAFNEHKCEAAIAAYEPDEEEFTDKTLSYQVIQTLTNISQEDLETLASKTKNDILKLGTDKDVIFEVLGVTESNQHKNYFQQALEIYPNLLNDHHSRQVIKETKKQMVKRAKGGKILIPGTRRSFIAPDVYAFMEWLFAGKEDPQGLLAENEVSCALYGEEKLHLTRSPHLYREHAIASNKCNDETKDWFITNCIHTSTKSLISKLLMFDVDGDEMTICNDPTIVRVSEEAMVGIRVLDYELASTVPGKITNPNIYENLIKAYEKNIGEYANLITKVWNSNNIDEEAINVTKWLCYESNACIDFAKSLWFPDRPSHVNEKMKKYTDKKVPHFFRYADDRDKAKVEEVSNSVVDRLGEIIPNRRVHFDEVVEQYDHKKLLNNASVNITTDIAQEIIEMYEKLNKSKFVEMKQQSRLQGKTMRKVEYNVYNKIREKLRGVINDDIFITDVLVEYLYSNEKANKDSLWDMFGKVIVWNLKRNTKGVVECLDCQCVIEKTRQRQVRCMGCQEERNKFLKRERSRKKRQSKKVS